MPWWVPSLVANACIIATEYLNASAKGGWASVLPRTAVLIVVAQYCLFKSFNGAPHWLVAWAVFTIGNSGMRVAWVSLAGGEHSVGSWTHALLGITVMIGGAFLVKEGLR